MRNAMYMADTERKFKEAFARGDETMALYYHRILTTQYINAEWECKEDMLSTISQLEAHCACLEKRGLFLDWSPVIFFVLGLVYGPDVVNMFCLMLDFMYAWITG